MTQLEFLVHDISETDLLWIFFSVNNFAAANSIHVTVLG